MPSFHFDVAANSVDEARQLARARAEKKEYCQAPLHKEKIKVVSADELPLETA
jgi:hypothetical protein